MHKQEEKEPVNHVLGGILFFILVIGGLGYFAPTFADWCVTQAIGLYQGIVNYRPHPF